MSRTRTAGTIAGGVLLGVALTIASIQAWNVSAAPGDVDATYQPLEPCRLLDTRTPDGVGDRKAPIGPGETFTAQVTGTNGNCTNIPAGAVGIAANITAVNPTAPSFLSVFPADVADPPLVSNLNYSNGSPPTPNKVDVKLSPDGKIKIYNAFGTVDVIVDVAGVYVNSSLTEISNRLAALEAEDSALHARISDQRTTTQSVNGGDRAITSAWTNVLQLSAPISRNGAVIVFASATAFENTAGEDVQCVITDTPASVTADRSMLWEASGATAGSTAGEGDAGVVSGTRSFSVTGGTSGTFALMCRNTASGGSSQIWSPHITVIFVRR